MWETRNLKLWSFPLGNLLHKFLQLPSWHSMVPLIVRFLQFSHFSRCRYLHVFTPYFEWIKSSLCPTSSFICGTIAYFTFCTSLHDSSSFYIHLPCMYMLSITCMHVLNPSLCPQLCLFSIVWRPEPICVMSASKQTYQRPWASIDGEDHRDDQYPILPYWVGE